MHDSIIVTIDLALLTLYRERLHVLVHQRAREPYRQQLALPGGYIHPQEDQDALAAARRILHDKTGLRSPYLEQLFTFSGGVRDPRGWSISIAYYALVHADRLHEETPTLRLLPVDELPDLPFDHNRIVDAAVKRVRDKSTYSSLPCHLLPEHFTLTELQQTYEQVLGTKLDKSVFRRKLAEMDFLEMTDSLRTGKHRPAQLYRLRPEKSLIFFNKTV